MREGIIEESIDFFFGLWIMEWKFLYTFVYNIYILYEIILYRNIGVDLSNFGR